MVIILFLVKNGNGNGSITKRDWSLNSEQGVENDVRERETRGPGRRCLVSLFFVLESREHQSAIGTNELARCLRKSPTIDNC